MIAKEYLSAYEVADRRARSLKIGIEELEISIDAIRSTSDNNGMPHGNDTGDPTGMKATKLADQKKEYANALIEAETKKGEIFKKIINIDGVESEVLIEKYIHYWQTWDQIADKLGYSTRHCKNIHGNALNNFRKIYKMQ